MKLKTEIIQLSSIEVITLTDELDILIDHDTHVLSLVHGPSDKLIHLRTLETIRILFELIVAVLKQSGDKSALLQEKLLEELT